MRRSWHDQYPPGVAAEIGLCEFVSLNEMFLATCRQHSQKPSWRYLGVTITYGQLERLSRDLAAYLQSLPGLKPGARVALMMPNVLQYPIAIFAVLRAGFIVVNVNPLYTATELEHQLNDSGAEVLIVLETAAHVAASVVDKTPVRHVITTSVGEMLTPFNRAATDFAVRHVKKLVPAWSIPGARAFRAALREGRPVNFCEAEPEREDIALLQYTGGTTGVARGAILTHGNLLANVLQLQEWFKGVTGVASETWLAAMPLYHITSFLVSFLTTRLANRGLLVANPRDISAVVRDLRDGRPTVITGVNTFFNALLNHPEFAAAGFSQLKLVVGGAAPIQTNVAERWHATTAQPIVQGYGLTETSGVVSVNPPGMPFNGSVGLPLPSTDVAIRDDDGHEVPCGCEGEICVHGPQVTAGYWQRPADTAEALTADGWFRTGDIGKMDERGYLRITDRKKDMIIISGFKVFPSEVENAISSLSGVAECGVVGEPDGRGGEIVKAVVKRGSADLTPEAVLQHCRLHLTSYKVPKLIEFRDELPKNPIGKVLRRRLVSGSSLPGD